MIDLNQLKQRTKNVETVSCKITAEAKRRLDEISNHYNISISDLIRALITQFLTDAKDLPESADE